MHKWKTLTNMKKQSEFILQTNARHSQWMSWTLQGTCEYYTGQYRCLTTKEYIFLLDDYLGYTLSLFFSLLLIVWRRQFCPKKKFTCLINLLKSVSLYLEVYLHLNEVLRMRHCKMGYKSARLLINSKLMCFPISSRPLHCGIQGSQHYRKSIPSYLPTNIQLRKKMTWLSQI